MRGTMAFPNKGMPSKKCKMQTSRQMQEYDSGTESTEILRLRGKNRRSAQDVTSGIIHSIDPIRTRCVNERGP